MIIPPGLTDFEGVPQEDEKLRWEEGTERRKYGLTERRIYGETEVRKYGER